MRGLEEASYQERDHISVFFGTGKELARLMFSCFFFGVQGFFVGNVKILPVTLRPEGRQRKQNFSLRDFFILGSNLWLFFPKISRQKLKENIHSNCDLMIFGNHQPSDQKSNLTPGLGHGEARCMYKDR